MHFSTTLVLASAALIQGGLSARITAFTGRDCTGEHYDTNVVDNSQNSNLRPFISYRENGYGGRGQRIAFYGSADCATNYLYDTWAYGGDYFKSKTCYNLETHTTELGHHFDPARCVVSYAA